MAYTGLTRTLLQVLASHPEGLTTPELAEAIWRPSQPWQQVLNKCGIAMRNHERLGRAVRAGTARPGRYRAVRWRITPDGAAWLADRALTALRDARDAVQAQTHARDLRVAASRMVQFHNDPGRPDDGGSSPARPAPLPAGQWTVQGLAAELRMPAATLYGWIYEDRVNAEFGDRWVVHADPAELARLRELRAQHQPADQLHA